MSTPQFLLPYQISADQKDEFLKFVSQGSKNSDGEFEVDSEGNKMTGVIDWLNQNGLKTTQIYTRDEPGGDLLFAATADSILPDWAGIPGFADKFPHNRRMQLNANLNAQIKR
jgi:hypothetical protein